MRTQLLHSLPGRPVSLVSSPICSLSQTLSLLSISRTPAVSHKPFIRAFSSTPAHNSWLEPRRGYFGKSRKGRPRVPTGGSMRGTTVVWGDYGLRMCDHDRRVSAKQLAIGADTIKKRLRGERYKLYFRVAATIPVFTSGNEMRMGKGKGSFDYFASRIAVSKIIFEIKGEVHERVVRDAFRLAAAKMPGQYEFVKKGDPPVMGLSKVTDEHTLQQLLRPRREPAPETPANPVPVAELSATPTPTISASPS